MGGAIVRELRISAAMQWLPLESNPDALNTYAGKLGLSPSAQFVDVYGFDDELLMMVPKPVLAVMLLFPLTDAHEQHSAKEAAQIANDAESVSDNLFFMRQTIGNACGTIGLLHALGSRADTLVTRDSLLDRFFIKAKTVSPDQRAKLLEEEDGIASAHSDCVNDGQTAVPDSVKLHFITFTVVDGILYELDGRKPRPVTHGPAPADGCLNAAVKVIRKFMARAPESLNFNAMALTSM